MELILKIRLIAQNFVFKNVSKRAKAIIPKNRNYFSTMLKNLARTLQEYRKIFKILSSLYLTIFDKLRRVL